MFKINNDVKITKCIRFPKYLIEQIEKETKKDEISFTKFVIEACKYALENIEK